MCFLFFVFLAVAHRVVHGLAGSQQLQLPKRGDVNQGASLRWVSQFVLKSKLSSPYLLTSLCIFEGITYLKPLRTVTPIVTAHIFWACQGSRALRRTRGLVLSPLSLEGSSYFLWKRCVVFQKMKNNFYLPSQFFENRRNMRMLLFLRVSSIWPNIL